MPTSLNTDELKTEMVGTIQFLHAQGWAPATSSNYSFRLPGDKNFWISASGIDKRFFAREDFIPVDSKGLPILGDRKTSAETLLHALIFDCFPEANCILHSHSVHNTLCSVLSAQQGFVELKGFEMLKGLRGISSHEAEVRIPVFQNSQNMELLSAEIRKFFQSHGEPQGFLLGGHGLYTWAENVASARRQMEVLEFLFEVIYKLKVLNPK